MNKSMNAHVKNVKILSNFTIKKYLTNNIELYTFLFRLINMKLNKSIKWYKQINNNKK